MSAAKRAAVIGGGALLATGALYVAAVAGAVTLWASLWTVGGWTTWV